MQIPLNGFEDYIGEIILERGLNYFQKGRVAEPIVIDKGKYEFDVRGSDDYLVRLTVNENIVVDYSCDCPYDMGAVCKHVAAAIFYLQKDVLDLGAKHKKEKKERKRSVSNPNDPKNVNEQVNILLGKLSFEDMKVFIREKAKEEPSFRNMFLTSFAHLNDDYSKEYYRKQIETILIRGSGKNGFIEWSDVRNVTSSVNEFLDAARKLLKNGRYQGCFNICTAVMEEMVEALQYSDDSNGDVSDCVSDALSILEEMISSNMEEEIRLMLLEYFVSAYLKNVFEDWDWHTEILVLSAMLVKSDEEGERIIAFAKNEDRDGYRENFSRDIELMIYKNTKSDEEIKKFLEKNISNPDFRRQLINKAIEDKDFEKAIKLAKEGLKEKKSNWYDFDLWNGLLFRIAELQGDREKVIEYSRVLFLDENGREKDYYGILKKNVETDKWSEFVEGLITDLKKRKRSHEVRNVYIKEQWWDRLYESLKKDPSLSEVQYYEKYLKQDYKDEIIGFYETGIYNYMKGFAERHHYKEACRYMRRMLKLGARERVDLMIEKLRKEYPRRPALLDELSKV
ncbi:MAG: hypothetical protein NTY74_02960 [Ignavibacteriae bacterium]|nr:hypothetical protein [Ignavibacteriota bacterium]